ncbi:MAG: DUF4134 domain-containing protein [Prevotella sp.]|nr:DUF4134 domain-containing protein [Prevotella sp.]
MNKTILSIAGGTKRAFASAGKKIKAVVTDPRCAAVMLLVAFSVLAVDVQAQSMDTGVQAIQASTDSLKKYIPVVTSLCYVLAGIVGIVGGISVYIKMNNEEQDVKKSIMMIVGACVFLIAAAQAIPLFFGL